MSLSRRRRVRQSTRAGLQTHIILRLRAASAGHGTHTSRTPLTPPLPNFAFVPDPALDVADKFGGDTIDTAVDGWDDGHRGWRRKKKKKAVRVPYLVHPFGCFVTTQPATC